MKNFISQSYSFCRQQLKRYESFTPVPRLMLLVAGLLLIGGVTVAATRPAHVISIKTTVPPTSQPATSKNPAATSSSPTVAANNTSPAASTSSQATLPPVTASANTALAMTLSSSTATVATGSQTPTFTATSQTGTPLSWTVLGAASLVLVNGVSSANPEVTHSFSFSASPAVKPGVYTYTVTGYIAHGASVSKQVTITVTQGPTFTLAALPADHSNDRTYSTFSIPFQIRPLAGALSNTTASAAIIDAGGMAMSYQGIQDNGSNYSKAVIVYGTPIVGATLTVRVTVSDGVYSTSLDIPYTMN